MKTKQQQIAVGTKVLCNDFYIGTVSEVHTGQLKGMVTVKLKRGEVCVDILSVEVVGGVRS